MNSFTIEILIFTCKQLLLIYNVEERVIDEMVHVQLIDGVIYVLNLLLLLLVQEVLKLQLLLVNDNVIYVLKRVIYPIINDLNLQLPNQMTDVFLIMCVKMDLLK